jgi:diguanylate cyclase (GGDEF)-like protein/putative nucleotidyltransferase with HDIG domain
MGGRKAGADVDARRMRSRVRRAVQRLTNDRGSHAVPGPAQDEAAAAIRVASAIDHYLYTNEHCPDGTRRSVFSGPNRAKLMGGAPAAGVDIAVEWERLIHPDDWDQHLAHRARLRAGQPSQVRYRLRGYDGRTRWVHAQTHPATVDGRLFVDGIVSDVTEQVAAELELARARADLERLAAANEHLALHDGLTGLGNKRRLMVALDEAIASGEEWILALFDLDGFKGYNDTFGHPAGDDLLVRLASKLEDATHPGASFRFGGDEFLILMKTDGDLEAMLARAASALAETGEGFDISASFGAVLIPTEAGTADDAMRLCDQRLYNEKHNRTERRGRPQDALLEALNAREGTLEDHSKQVARLAVAVAGRLGLSPPETETLRQAALLHDVGKIGIPDATLSKQGPLTEQEWSLIRRHTVIGERILAASPALTTIAKIVRSTHERIDGTGYPDSLSGDDICIEARIISACDAFSAMTSDRTYRPALSQSDALAELHANAGTQFDPAVVHAMLHVVNVPEHT